MLSTGFKTWIAPRARALLVIWGAILLAPIMYVVIAWFLFGRADDFQVPQNSQLPWSQIGMGALLVLGMGASYYQRMALSPARVKAVLSVEPIPPAGKDRDLFEMLTSGEKRLAGLWQHYQTTMIIVWAMLEGMAVVGLVLTILQKDFRVMIPFAIAAVLLLILKRPQPGKFFAGIKL
jgi:hypothetical protein